MNKRTMNFLTCMLLALAGNLSGVWEQPPLSTGEIGFTTTAIASDANGNAATIMLDVNDVNVYNYSSTTDTWSGPILLQSNVFGEVAIAMDNGGRAIAIWTNNFPNSEVRTAVYDGSTWTPGSPDPLETGTSFVSSPRVVMNGPNSALAAWINGDTSSARASFFNGVWSAPTSIGTTDNFLVRVAYSANGTAVAGFINSDAVAANYIGGVWQAPVTLNIGAVTNYVDVGIDASGKALAVWRDDTSSTILSSFFNGTSWQAPITLGANAFNSPAPLAMAPTGTAVAVWSTNGPPFIGLSRAFNGVTWAPAMQFASNIGSNFNLSAYPLVDVEVDDFGNAILIFCTQSDPSSTTIQSARLPLGGIWDNFQTVSVTEVPHPVAGWLGTDLSNNGFAFASWGVNNPEGFLSFASVDPFLYPPGNIQGSVCKDKFTMQTDCVNTITFTPSPSMTVSFYGLSRNGVLIAVIPAAGPFIYQDHNRCKEVDVYALVAVGPNGLMSLPVTIVLP